MPNIGHETGPCRLATADCRLGMPPFTPARLRKDFLSVLDFDSDDLDRCLRLAAQLKADRPLRREAPTADALAGRHVAMLFDKPSLRTRTTFDISVRELGGHVVA